MITLDIQGLTIDYRGEADWVRAVSGVSLQVHAGEVYGLVGESGSGKTTLGLAALGHVPPGGRAAGRVQIEGRDVLTLPRPALQKLRGRRLGFVPQNPTTALNPAMRVGAQLAETLRQHTDLDAAAINARMIELFAAVRLPDPAEALTRFPHQLSGGQQQRVTIAMALACRPALIILDEPTTGLDVTVQRQIVSLLKSLRQSEGVAMLYITHDLPLLSSIADRIGVMRRGELVEEGAAEALFTRPRASYTRELVAAIPDPDAASPSRDIGAPPLLVASNLRLGYRRGWWPGTAPRIVGEDLTLTLAQDETVALIGESGSGKSTFARALAGVLAPLAGEITFEGRALSQRAAARPQSDLKAIQYIFQNPDASLNPRATVGDALARPLGAFFGISGATARERAAAALVDVGLTPDYLERYPSALSGGQRQRVAIARAILAEPRILLCDEVLSALDVSVQARVLDLLIGLRERQKLAMLFISHDLAVVRRLADRIAVMQAGRIVETGPTEQIFNDPQHAYTKSLLSAIQRIPRAA